MNINTSEEVQSQGALRLDFSHIKLQKEVKSSRLSERSDLVGYFTRQLNVRQKSRGAKEYSPRFIALKLTKLSTQDLYFLKSECEHSDNWYRCFWGSIKGVDKSVD